MARITGVNLPPHKMVEISLTYLFGVGRSLSQKILAEAKIDSHKRVKDLTDKEVETLKNIIEKKYKVEGELRQEISANVRRLKEIGCYRGSRHAKRLPVRGQRTKTNSRTVRGNVRKTAASGRRSPARKV